MSERQTIIGFTEAELGFFLALLALVFLVVLAGSGESDTSIVQLPADSVVAMEGQLAMQAKLLDSLSRTLDSIREGSSDMTPYCHEQRVGLADGPLFRVKILDPQTFEVRGDTLDRAEFLAITERNRAEAAEAGCVHEVLVDFSRDLTAPELHDGRRFLSSMFRLRSVS